MRIERDLAGHAADGIPAAIRAGGLIFVDACEGGSGQTGVQCDTAYRALADRLQLCGSSAKNVVRLDHFTESQGWLSERQKVRARYFGRPAPLASTGVAVRHCLPNRLSVAGIAVDESRKKSVRIEGGTFGMPAIATAVQSGNLVFISGILNDGGLAAEKDDAVGEFARQARGCFATIGIILKALGLTSAHIVRQDIYVAEGCSYDDLVGLSGPADFLSLNAARSGARLPFGAPDLIEVTTIAVLRDVYVLDRPSAESLGATVRASGFCFTDSFGDTAAVAVANLVKRLESVGVPIDAFVRLDVCCADAGELARVRQVVSSTLGTAAPVVVAYSGLPLSGRAVAISGISALGGY